MRSHALACLILLLAGAVTCCRGQATSRAAGSAGGRATLPAAGRPRLQATECWGAVPAGVLAECAWLTVPERHEAPAGKRYAVRLAVMVLRAPGVRYTQPPTLVLGGGPGQDVIALYLDLFSKYRRLQEKGYPPARRFMPLEDMRQFRTVMAGIVGELKKRELVLFDQRGAGFSQPSLKCHGESPGVCRARLAAQGIDLAAYNTLENARDVDDLRLALGQGQVNLQAGSYGTRLALEVLRRYPGTVRAVVLDGVVPPQFRWAREMVARYGVALDVLFRHCQEDARCAAAYPQLDSVFYRTVQRLNAQPLGVVVGERTVLLGGDDLRDMVWNALFDVQKARWLPATIWRASRGDPTLWGQLLAANAEEHSGEPISWGMHFSVECAGSWAFESRDELARAARGLHPALREGVVRTLGEAFAICREWRVPPLPEVREPVSSDVPALLLSGEFDPAAPPAFAEVAARTLSHGYRYVLPYLGHSDGFTSACHASIVAAFLDDPAHAPPTTCLGGMDLARFAVE